MMRIAFHVDGTPIPQGSTRAFARNGRVVTTNDPSGRIERWRGDIRTAAKAVLPPGFEPLDGPVLLSACFSFARPKSHYLPVTKSRPEPVLRPDAPVYHDQEPDLDKLLRTLGDAMSVVVYTDDKLIARYGTVWKRWAPLAGASIEVCEIVE